MVPDHAPVIVCMVAPNRQYVVYALLLMSQHGIYHIRSSFLLYQRKQRVQRPVSIPERKSSIVIETVGFVVVMIEPAIHTIHIHVEGW